MSNGSGDRFVEVPLTPAQVKQYAKRSEVRSEIVKHLATSDVKEALLVAKGYSDEYPDDLIALGDTARLHLANNQYDQAYDLYRRIVMPLPDSPEFRTGDIGVLTGYGDSCYALHHHDEARRAYETVLSKGKLKANGDFPDARLNGYESDLKKLAASAHVACGLKWMINANDGSKQQAVSHFKQALELYPGYESAQYYLAFTLTTDELRQFEKALDLLRDSDTWTDPSARECGMKLAEKLKLKVALIEASKNAAH
ncbi:MAG TPA: tetratricopeptide repeat protein [Fimbriimonas sp.]|nr:tetratricopeptide repeat protein [Fimbriimonas sp.]